MLRQHAAIQRGLAPAGFVLVTEAKQEQTILRQLPIGAQPPLILNFSASSVPILQLALFGQGLSEQQLNDLGLNFLRP